MGGHPVLVQASGRLGGTSPPEHCEAGPAPLGSWPVGVGLLCSWGWHGGASPVTSAGTWRGSGLLGFQAVSVPWVLAGERPLGLWCLPPPLPQLWQGPASCHGHGIACVPHVALRRFHFGGTGPPPSLVLWPHVEEALFPFGAAALLGRCGDVGPGACLPRFWAPAALGSARSAAGCLARAGGSAGTARAHVGSPEPVPWAGGRGCPRPPVCLSLPGCQGGAALAPAQGTRRWPWLWLRQPLVQKVALAEPCVRRSPGLACGAVRCRAGGPGAGRVLQGLLALVCGRGRGRRRWGLFPVL